MTTVAAVVPDERKTLSPEARPYGLVGLLVSVVFILAGAALLCVLGGAAALGVAALALGWHQALDAISALRTSTAADDTQLARAGVLVSLAGYAAISAAVMAASRFRGGRRWRDLLAWHPWHPFRAARLFWAVAAATIAYSLAADAIISRYYPPSRDWVTLPKGPLWVGLFVVLAVIMAPLTEELLFRGWLYTSLRAKIGVIAGILVTAVLFALAHWEKSHLYALAVFPVGLALGFFRERSGSLLASMTFHAVYNAAALATLIFGY